MLFLNALAITLGVGIGLIITLVIAYLLMVIIGDALEERM